MVRLRSVLLQSAVSLTERPEQTRNRGAGSVWCLSALSSTGSALTFTSRLSKSSSSNLLSQIIRRLRLFNQNSIQLNRTDLGPTNYFWTGCSDNISGPGLPLLTVTNCHSVLYPDNFQLIKFIKNRITTRPKVFRLLAVTEASSRTADRTRTLLIPTSAFRVCVHAEICL